MTTLDDSLRDELGYFREHKDELLRTAAGQFALIHGRELVGTFTTFGEAYAEGVRRFGNVPMLIRRIQAEDPSEQAPAFLHGLLRPGA